MIFYYMTYDLSRSTNLPLPSNSQTFEGDLTYFQTGLGACGETNSDSDNIVSVSHIIFDAAGSSSSKGGNSNFNPLCGLMLRAERYDEDRGERRSVDLKVVDRCTGCQSNDLDVTYSAFDKLASRSRGRVEVTWAWL
jgi:expansin (peptidoglycan-binding protein)